MKKVHMQTFAQKRMVDTTLTEQLKIEGEDYIIAQMHNTFKHEGSDVFKASLRNVEPQFSDGQDFMTDVQVAFNENYINYQLVQLHESMIQSTNNMSLRDFVLWKVRKWNEHISGAIYGLFSTFILRAHFPELVSSIENTNAGTNLLTSEHPVDISCSLQNDLLDDDEHGITQVKFREGNIIEFEAHLGCAIMYNRAVEMWGETAAKANYRDEPEDWVTIREIFGSVEGKVYFDFDHTNTHAKHGYITGHIDDLELKFSEIVVMDGDEEIWSEEEMINIKLEQLRQAIQLTGIRAMIDMAQ